MRLPFDGDYVMTVPFGEPDNGRGWWLDGYHTGIDYALPTGTRVLAMASGRLDRRGLMGGKGLVVQLDHGEGLVSRYAHLDGVAESFDGVAEGQHVAYSGATGFVTGPHLHWEVLRDGAYIDPLSLFVATDPALADIDGLWRIAGIIDRYNHRAEADEMRRLLLRLKQTLGFA